MRNSNASIKNADTSCRILKRSSMTTQGQYNVFMGIIMRFSSRMSIPYLGIVTILWIRGTNLYGISSIFFCCKTTWTLWFGTNFCFRLKSYQTTTSRYTWLINWSLIRNRPEKWWNIAFAVIDITHASSSFTNWNSTILFQMRRSEKRKISNAKEII